MKGDTMAWLGFGALLLACGFVCKRVLEADERDRREREAVEDERWTARTRDYEEAA